MVLCYKGKGDNLKGGIFFMSRINNNLSSLNTQRFLRKNTNAQGGILEKLSSGLSINRAADDAAGLSISQKMRANIRALDRSSKNIQDGISLVQTADGALDEVHTMLERMTELSEQALDGIYTTEDLDCLNVEFMQLQDQIDDIGNNATFNNKKIFVGSDSGNSKKLFDGKSFEIVFTSEQGVKQNFSVSYNIAYDSKTDSINLRASNAQTARDANAVIPDGYKNLANKVANEYLPNILDQIAGKLPSLSKALNDELAKNSRDKIQLMINITNIDGKNGTLASAQYAYYNIPGSEAVQMQLNIDSSDFSDASIGTDDETLESTLAHELMHSVMQYVFTDEMSGRTDSSYADKFDTWFKEGVAQLSGGGFPTNWNNELRNIVSGLSSESDTSKDSDVADYLKKYSVTGRPYGHGYLASAYIGHVVGNGDVAAGIDKLFDELYKNPTMSLAKYLSDNHSNIFGTNTSNSALKNKIDDMFKNPTNDLTAFVRSFAKKAGNGAGSIIADNLSDGGSNIIKNNTSNNKLFYIDLADNTPSGVVSGGEGGGNDGPWKFGVDGTDNVLTIDIGAMNINVLGISKGSVNLKDQENAASTFNAVKNAVKTLSVQRSRIGAYHNRLDYTYNNVMNVVENMTAAESRIRDADMSGLMSEFTKKNILVQSATSMLGQANQTPQSVLQLLS